MNLSRKDSSGVMVGGGGRTLLLRNFHEVYKLRSSTSLGLGIQPCLLLFLLLLLKKSITIVLGITLHLLSLTPNNSLDIVQMKILGFRNPKKKFQKGSFNTLVLQTNNKTGTQFSEIVKQGLSRMGVACQCYFPLQLSDTTFWKQSFILWRI